MKKFIVLLFVVLFSCSGGDDEVPVEETYYKAVYTRSTYNDQYSWTCVTDDEYERLLTLDLVAGNYVVINLSTPNKIVEGRFLKFGEIRESSCDYK